MIEKCLLVALVLFQSRCDDSRQFDEEIVNFAVGNGTLYVATNVSIYQLLGDLTIKGKRVFSNSPNMVKILVPFVKNHTLISCATGGNGYCEVIAIDDIKTTIHAENIPRILSLGFLMNTMTDVYFVTGGDNLDPLIALRETRDGEGTGGIFSEHGHSRSTPIVKRSGTNLTSVEYIDGFQLATGRIYIIMNLNLNANSKQVRLLWMQSHKEKDSILKSIRGVELKCCKDRPRPQLLSSATIDSSLGLWAGVFAAGDEPDLENTALAIFNINLNDINLEEDSDPYFCSTKCRSTLDLPKSNIEPKAVVFTYPSMTSVAAMMVNSWLMLFVGTGDGRLIKLAVDKNLKPTCPVSLYRSDDDRPVFSRMLLDPVDNRHIYVVLGNEIRTVPVAKCGGYRSMRDCWSVQDPFCGWCVSKNRCTFSDECNESVWISTPEDSAVQEKMLSFKMEERAMGDRKEINMNVIAHMSVKTSASLAFSCAFITGSTTLCNSTTFSEPLQCSCSFPIDKLPTESLNITVKLNVGGENLTERFALKNCSGTPRAAMCLECNDAGCSWSFNDRACSRKLGSSTQGQSQDVCETNTSSPDVIPVINFIDPNTISIYGKNNAKISGRNLDSVTQVRIQGNMACRPKESPVWNRSNGSLTFHIPSGDKGVVSVCALLPNGECHGSAKVTYFSRPSCTGFSPNSTWASGGRTITVLGTELQFVDRIQHYNFPEVTVLLNSSQNLRYQTPRIDLKAETEIVVRLGVANETVACKMPITYYPDPKFTRFLTTPTENKLRIIIEKNVDKMNIDLTELKIYGVEGDREHRCQLKEIPASGAVLCEIMDHPNANIQSVKIKLGNLSILLEASHTRPSLMILIALGFVPFIIIAVVCVYRAKQRELSRQMNKRLELLECEIREDIRQGFVDMQTETSALYENVGAIPFLDYKHFASRIFFPEATPAMTPFLKDIGQVTAKTKAGDGCQALSRLIRDQLFLTSFVHALEEQRNFTIKDKCTVASLLTLALHGDLPYLTEVMEDLLRALMGQSGAAQPKLLLRRTESIVEKLLTNWMSICLYGFLRECVGQTLYLLVSALNQQISKGPIDSVTEKALYTLNEDWLLWQAPDFNTLKLKVWFPEESEEENCEPLEVCVLDCDTVEQVKEKVLMTFRMKFGFPHRVQLQAMDLVIEKEDSLILLREVDGSSQVLGEVTMLNTLRHYQVPDGASLKVIMKEDRNLKTQVSLKDEKNYSTKYFHLIDPDIDQDWKVNPETKKLKLKEVQLTKLLSTKVAVHTFVEGLFHAIWGTAHQRVPPAIKHFFDFLDAQADRLRITDPDVPHIWKTNSLPLRFWVNILKNPQFVFDMEKTAHLDGCMSVIAQAFMDSFSLTEQPLGKHAPTNKLLYAKDVPQFRQEVRAYYKQVRDLPPLSGPEFRTFLLEESKKHENEFDQSAALHEIYKYVVRYFGEINGKLVQNGASSELIKQLEQAKDLFNGQNKCSWD